MGKRLNAIEREVEAMRLAEAEALFAVTVHRDARGNPMPTIFNIGEPARFTKELGEEMHRHLSAIAETLRKAYAGRGITTNP
jgi:hypothetical protein